MFIKFCMCPSCPIGIESGVWDVIVLIPDTTFSFYLFRISVGPANDWKTLSVNPAVNARREKYRLLLLHVMPKIQWTS